MKRRKALKLVRLQAELNYKTGKFLTSVKAVPPEQLQALGPEFYEALISLIFAYREMAEAAGLTPPITRH